MDETISVEDIPGLVERWHKPLLVFARQQMTQEAGEDAVQDTWQRLFTTIKAGGAITREGAHAWLYRVLTNRIIDVKRHECLIPMLPLEHPEWEPSRAGWERSVEAWADVCQALAPLPRIYQQIVWFLTQDYSGPEIARIVKMPEGTVRMRILRARQMLREQEVA